MTQIPVLLTAQEVADAARVSRLTVNRWAREKKLAGIRVGAGWRFEREDVVAFLNGTDKQAGQVTPTTEDPARQTQGA